VKIGNFADGDIGRKITAIPTNTTIPISDIILKP
jgi:hypothetical protein